jgi:nicotinamidase-related amidase
MTDWERGTLLKNAKILIQGMKAAGRPIVWVTTVLRHDNIDNALSSVMQEVIGQAAEKGFLVDGSWGSEMTCEIRPNEEDIVVVKKGHSAFQFTYLDRLLSNLEVNACVTIGGEVSGCLADSVRQGGALGYEMIIPADATFPPNSPYIQNLWNRAVLTTSQDFLASLSPSEATDTTPRKMALLVVDMQNDFIHPEGLRNRLGYRRLSDGEVDLVIHNNQRLILAMRQKGNPIIFVMTTHRRDMLDSAPPPIALINEPFPPEQDYLSDGTWGAQIVDGLEVREEDLILNKKARSSFCFTPLHRVLRNLRVGQCIVTGGAIHACVEDTVREGVGFGYRFTVVSDATYKPNSPTLAVMANHAKFKTTNEILTGLNG